MYSPHYAEACNEFAVLFSATDLDICPKNVVILFTRKHFCAVGLELGLGLGLRLGLKLAKIRVNTFSVKRPAFGQFY